MAAYITIVQALADFMKHQSAGKQEQHSELREDENSSAVSTPGSKRPKSGVYPPFWASLAIDHSWGYNIAWATGSRATAVQVSARGLLFSQVLLY